MLLMAGGCSNDDGELEKYALSGDFPIALNSSADAEKYVRLLHIRGRVDHVSIGLARYMVVFQHGSGLPVIKIAVYRRSLSEWKLVAEPTPAHSKNDAPRDAEFLKATASSGKIMVVGERSKIAWFLYDPSEARDS